MCYKTWGVNLWLGCRNQSDVVDFESECWSDDSEIEKLSRSTSSGSSKIWDSVSDDSACDTPSMRDKLGSIEFQYFESAKPHLRVPLTTKVFISSDPMFFIVLEELNNLENFLGCWFVSGYWIGWEVSETFDAKECWFVSSELDGHCLVSLENFLLVWSLPASVFRPWSWQCLELLLWV